MESPKKQKSGMYWLGVAVVALLSLSVWAQAPRKGATMRRDNSPIVPTIPKADRSQTNRVFLERADELRKGRTDDYQIVVGNVLFRRGGMYMYCDSAHFYDAAGRIEAFGNVHMEQGDTLFVYADELVYSDSTRLATLYGWDGKKVRLINRDVKLTTDIFNYDLDIDLGYYETGGVLTDPKNRLTSWYGEYSPTTKDALFAERVELHSLRDGDTLDIFSEQLLYNTYTHVAFLDTISTIVSADGVIHTSNGRYNTDTQVADLYDRSTVVASNGNTLTGDTLFYDRPTGFGEAFGNIELVDTSRKVMLTGDYGVYYEFLDSARVFGNALAREYSQKDTLYLHGDTITTFRRIILPPAPAAVVPDVIPDSFAVAPSAELVVADSAAAVVVDEDAMEEIVRNDSVAADTVHYLVAAPNVKFYRVDLQGLCDSMTFVSTDSLLHLDRHPVVWNGQRQIFGNKIILHLNDSTVDWARLPQFGFVAEHIEDEFYNQLTGKEMYATFLDGELHHLDVSGNVQAIMLPQEEDSTYNKIANIESSYLAADFEHQELQRMKMWPETSGTMTPLYLARRQLYFLPQFRWFEPLRPMKPEDVFVVTKEMRDLFAEPPFGTSRR